MLDKLKIGSLVLYEGELYQVTYVYNSGYCEIVKQVWSIKANLSKDKDAKLQI